MEVLAALTALLFLAVIVLSVSVWLAHEGIARLQDNLNNTRAWIRQVDDSLESIEEGDERILDRLAKVITDRRAASELGKKVIAAVGDHAPEPR